MNKAERKEKAMKAMQEKQTPGIFKLICQDSGRVYLGASMVVEKAYNRHVSELNFKSHVCRNLQNDWDTYGEKSFMFEPGPYIPEDRDPDFAYLMKMLDAECKKLSETGKEAEKLLM